jgi:hypothetical protein
MCGGIPLNKVQGLSLIALTGGSIPNNPFNNPEDGCVFVTNITNIKGASNGTINDSSKSPYEWNCGDGTLESWINAPCSEHLPQKVDGGYYIASKAYGNINYSYLTAFNLYGNQLHPNCEAAK